MKKTFVLSLGGSLVNPGQVDTAFLKKFKALILSHVKKGGRFILVVGGGRPARLYQEALSSVTKPSSEDLDWMGIYATRFNAELVRLSFGKLAHGEIITDPSKPVTFNTPILVASGWKPGWSTDFDAVTLAKNHGAEPVINLSNIAHAYTKDPKKFKTAKKIENISWKEFRKIVGSTWKPGANLPFDPIASKLAEKHSISVIITSGKDLKNLENILEGKSYSGTTVS